MCWHIGLDSGERSLPFGLLICVCFWFDTDVWIRFSAYLDHCRFILVNNTVCDTVCGTQVNMHVILYILEMLLC